MQDHVFVRGVRSTVGHSVATMDYLYEIINVFRTCSTRLFLCRPIQTSVVEHFFSSLLLLSYIFVYFFSFFRWTVSNRGPQMRRHRVQYLIWVLTVWPSKKMECYINITCYSDIIYHTYNNIYMYKVNWRMVRSRQTDRQTDRQIDK